MSKTRSVWPKWRATDPPRCCQQRLKHPLRKKLRAWQTDCDSEEQVVTLLNRSQPQNETTDNTERILPASVDQNPHRHLAAQQARGQTQTSLGTDSSTKISPTTRSKTITRTTKTVRWMMDQRILTAGSRPSLHRKQYGGIRGRWNEHPAWIPGIMSPWGHR
jgi:hypothetical protein